MLKPQIKTSFVAINNVKQNLRRSELPPRHPFSFKLSDTTKFLEEQNSLIHFSSNFEINRVAINTFKRSKKFSKRLSSKMEGIVNKLVSFHLIIAILVEFVLSPAIFDLAAEPFGDTFKRNTQPRGRLETYYNNGNQVREEAEWDRIAHSGKSILSAEWEAKAVIEIEDRIKIKTPSEDESSLRAELEVKKSLAKAEWETEITKEIDEKKGSWKAKINSVALNDLLKNIDVEKLIQAVIDANTLEKNTSGSAQDKLVAWDSIAKERANILRAEWEAELSQQITNLKGSVVTFSADEKASFESELSNIEDQFRARYKLEESGIVNMSRQSLVLNLNENDDLDGAIAQETDPSRLVALLIERTQKNIDENGDLKAEITQAYSNIPTSYNGITGDPNTKIQRALENGQLLWQKAIDDLLVQKLKFDKDASNKLNAGEDQWSKAYFELLKQRDNWSSKVNTQIQEGLKNWETSEIELKANKEKAIAELNRFIETSNVEWQSHVRGLEQVVVGSADSLKTIEDNIRWFDDALSKLEGNPNEQALTIYKEERLYWAGLRTQFQALIAKSQNQVHETDMRNNDYGVFPPTGNNGVLTLAEYNLKLASIELESLQQKRDRAKNVYDYALANSKKTKAEIATELSGYKTDYEAKEKIYLDLLALLNGGGSLSQVSVGLDPNSTTTTGTPTTPPVTALTKLEAANKILEEKRKILEIARADLDKSRENYENVLKLNVYVQNSNLLGNEIGIIAEVDGELFSSGIRAEINEASKNIENQKFLIRQQEKAIYQTMYEQENARRSRDYYQDLNKRIVEYEKAKDNKKRIHDIVDSDGDISVKVDALLAGSVLATTFSSSESLRIKGELTLLKQGLTDLDVPLKESLVDFGTRLDPILTAHNSLALKFSTTEKNKYQNYLDGLSSKYDQLKNTAGVDVEYLDDEDFQISKGYLGGLLNDWQTIQDSLATEFSEFQNAVDSYKSYVASHPGQEGSEAFQTKVFEMTRASNKYLLKASEVQTYLQYVNRGYSTLDTMFLDSMQRANVMIDASLTGEGRLNSQNSVKTLGIDYKVSSAEIATLNSEIGVAANTFSQAVNGYASSYNIFLNSKINRTAELEKVSGFVLTLVQGLDSAYQIQNYQMQFLLDENGDAEKLDALADASTLEARKEGSKLNSLAMEKLYDLISSFESNERNSDLLYSMLSGELAGKLQNLKTDASSVEELKTLSIVKDFITQNGGMLQQVFSLPESEFTKFMESLVKEKDQASATADFFNSNGSYTDAEREAIKEDGTDQEKRNLTDFYNFGSTFFFRNQLTPYISDKLDIAWNIKIFGEKIKSGEILTVLKDAYFQGQENKSTGLLKEIHDFVPGLADLKSVDFYNDSSNQTAANTINEEEVATRKGILAGILAKSFDEKIAELSDKSKLIQIFGNLEAGKIDTELDLQLKLWLSDKNAANGAADTFRDLMLATSGYDSYVSVFKNSNKQLFSDYALTQTGIEGIKAITEPIYKLANDQFGKTPGSIGYVETFEDIYGLYSYQTSGPYPVIDELGNPVMKNYDPTKKVITGYETPLANLDSSYLESTRSDLNTAIAGFDSIAADLISAYNEFKPKRDALLAFVNANPTNYQELEGYQDLVENMESELVGLKTTNNASTTYFSDLINKYSIADAASKAFMKQAKEIIGINPSKKLLIETDLAALPQEIKDELLSKPGDYIVVKTTDSALLKAIAKKEQDSRLKSDSFASLGKSGIADVATAYNSEYDRFNIEIGKLESISSYFLEVNPRRNQALPGIEDIIAGLEERIVVYVSGTRSNAISQDELLKQVKGLREYLVEKRFKGEEVNSSVYQALAEVEAFTNEIENLKYLESNPPSAVDLATSNEALKKSQEYKKNIEEAKKLMGETENLLGSFDSRGVPAYQSPQAVDVILKKYNEVKTKLSGSTFSFSEEVEEGMEKLTEHAWASYIKQIAISYLTGQAKNNLGESFDSVTQYMDSLKAGKFVVIGSDGKNLDQDAKFLGKILTNSQLSQVEEYLKVYDEKAKIADIGIISDLDEYLADKDPDLKAELKDQVLFAAYRNIQGAINSATFLDPSILPEELRSYAIVSSFMGYLQNMPNENGDLKFIPSDPNSREAAKNEMIANLGPGAEEFLPILNEYLSNFDSRNASYYLPQKLKELDAMEAYIYKVGTENLKPGDIAKLTEWIEQEKYDSGVETAMKKAVRINYILHNYYGEENGSYVKELDAKLKILDNNQGLTEEEKELFYLTATGFSPGTFLTSSMGYLDDPIGSISSSLFLQNFRFTNDFNELQKDLRKEALALEKETLVAESGERKEKFINDIKQGIISVNSYQSYLPNITTKSGIDEPVLAAKITARLKELEEHAELKMGSLMGMLEEYNSFAYLTPQGASDDKSRLSLSLQKTIQAVNQHYDYNVDQDLEQVLGDGTYQFEKDLNTAVITKINQYVNANDVNFTDNGPNPIVQAAYSMWNSLKDSIIDAGVRITITRSLVGRNLAEELSKARGVYDSYLDSFNLKDSEFATAKSGQLAEQANYTAKQKETSDAYNAMLAANKIFANNSAIYDYAALLEFSDHKLTTTDANGDPIQDTKIASPLELAKKRFQDADLALADQLKKVAALTAEKNRQVTLVELQNESLKAKQKEVEDWAMRAMRFSEAERKIRDEITRLRTNLNASQTSLMNKVAGAIGVSALGYGANLGSYVNYDEAVYKDNEKRMREIYFYVDELSNGDITQDTFIAGALYRRLYNEYENAVDEPDREDSEGNIIRGAKHKSLALLEVERYEQVIKTNHLFTKVNSKNSSLSSPFWDLIKNHGSTNAVSDMNGLMSFVYPGNGDALGGIFKEDWKYGLGGGNIHNVIKSEVDKITGFFFLVGWNTCGPVALCWLGVNIMAGNRIGTPHPGEKYQRLQNDYHKFLHADNPGNVDSDGLTLVRQRFIDDQARLNKLTQIQTTDELMNVLGGFGLTTEDLSFIKNTDNTFSGMEWQINERKLSIDELVGTNGNSIFQSRVLRDDRGLVVRKGNGDASYATMAVGNEMFGTLATLAETQYAVVRDEYYNMAKDFVNDKGVKVDQKVVLDEREKFMFDLINKAKDVNGGEGARNAMYKRLVRDYMGSDLAESGARTVTSGLSVVDEAMMLKNSQIREAELKRWDLQEKEFYAKKAEWQENMAYLKKTGEDQFKAITQEFTNRREAWRTQTKKHIQAESDKYTASITAALQEQKDWTNKFISKSQESGSEIELGKLYDSITSYMNDIRETLPGNVQFSVNANDVLQRLLENQPKELDALLLQAGKDVNTAFFIKEISNRGYDTKIVDEYAGLQKEMQRRSELMIKLQNVLELITLKDTYKEIINDANQGLKSRLNQEMGDLGWLSTGSGYTKLTNPGNIAVNIDGYKPYEYTPVGVPKVKDGNGKEWDLTDTNAIMSSKLTGGELGAMVSMAYKAMDVEFKKQYDPPKKEGEGITYETQSGYSLARQARAYQKWQGTGDGSNFKWDNKDYFLVGEVEKGSFGKNHHDEFWRILSTAENLTFLEEAYAGQQKIKAEQKAHRERIVDTAVTVAIVAVTVVGTIVAGPAGTAFGAYLYGAYSAYKAERAYQAGGEKGALLSVGSSAINFATGSYATGGGYSVNMSYTYADGYGASVGYSTGGTGGFNLGVSYSQKDGFGVYGGVELGQGFSIGGRVTERGGFGVNAGYTTSLGSSGATGALKVGYNFDKDGNPQGWNTEVGIQSKETAGQPRWNGALTYDSTNGYGGRIGVSGQDGNNNYQGSVAWSQKGGFASSYEMSYDWDRATANEARILNDAQKKIKEGKYNELTAEEKAVVAKVAEQKAKEAEARKKEQENVVEGVSILSTKSEEEIEAIIAEQLKSTRTEPAFEKRKLKTTAQKQTAIALQEELEDPNSLKALQGKVEKKVKEMVAEASAEFDKIIEDMGTEGKAIKAAHEAFKKSPSMENASKLFEAFDKSKASIPLSMAPYLGEVYDVLSISNDLYNKRYGDAAVGMAAAAIPFVPAKWAKAVKNNVLGKIPTVERISDFVSAKAKGLSDAVAAKYADLQAYYRKADGFVTNPFDANGKLKANVKYKTGEFGYIGETDAQGRLLSMSTDNLQMTERQKRLYHDSNTPGKEAGDHAGHLFGDRFGGSNKTDNIVSQLGKLNQGEYKKLENMWAKEIELGNKVAVTVDVIYDGSGSRPTGFKVRYSINGIRQPSRVFIN